jgi:hypothetical protein
MLDHLSIQCADVAASVDPWRRYLANPSLYLRHILDQEQP